MYKSPLYGHHYIDSTYGCACSTHGEINLTHLVLCAHIYL